jgi:hypothetical protein
MGYGLDGRGSIPGSGMRSFSTPQYPDRFWGPPSFLFSGYGGSLPGGKAVWACSLHLVPKSRMVKLYLRSSIRLHSIVLN